MNSLLTAESLGRALTTFFLVVLGAAWMFFVLPSARRASAAKPLPSAERFKAGMKSMAPGILISLPVAQAEPEPAGKSRTRRRDILVFLGAGFVFSGAAAVLSGGAWPLLSAFAGLFLLYVALLVEMRRRELDKRARIRAAAARSLGQAATRPRPMRRAG